MSERSSSRIGREAKTGRFVTIEKGKATLQGQHYLLKGGGKTREVVSSTASGTVIEGGAKRYAKAIKKLAKK